MRSVEAGDLASLLAGRRGRTTNSPPQLGHLLLSTVSAQEAQNVHSNEQIRASVESGGKSLPQHSQFGRSSSMSVSVTFTIPCVRYAGRGVDAIAIGPTLISSLHLAISFL